MCELSELCRMKSWGDMNLNSHPRPYGVFIGGNDMGTPSQTELYCAASGNGKFIVRGFGPEPFNERTAG